MPDESNRLTTRETEHPSTLWWLGVHGGAGESTLAGLCPGTRAAAHAWPISTLPGVRHKVVLVARTNYRGLMAAQSAAIEWASGLLVEAVELEGLVLIPDLPGRRPPALRDFERLVAGGVPQVWYLPWVDAWRVGPMPSDIPPPRAFRDLFADLDSKHPSPATAN